MGCEESFGELSFSTYQQRTARCAALRVGHWNSSSASQTAVAFLNSPPLSLHHSYLIPSTIFITPAMEWRLAGFDLLTTRDDPAGVLWGLGGIAPGNIGERCGPEVRKGGWGVLRE